IVGDAHEAARDVMRDGAEVSQNLRDLSASMRTNAERLLRDVRLTHGSMTARLDQAVPGGSTTTPPRDPPLRRSVQDGPEDDLDVPEFMPRD
ncbi:MAG: hypothetical protein WB998_11880, partial [Solirubrobacteraceae bacterium]